MIRLTRELGKLRGGAPRRRRGLALAREVLDTVWRFRDGGALGRVVTTLAVLESLVDHVDPLLDASEHLHRLGYRSAPLVLKKLWGRILADRTDEARLLRGPSDEREAGYVWDSEGVGVVLWPEHAPDVFVVEGPEALAGLGRLVRPAVWRAGSALQLRHSVRGSGRWSGSAEQVHFEPLHAPGPIVGSDVVSAIVRRVRQRISCAVLISRPYVPRNTVRRCHSSAPRLGRCEMSSGRRRSGLRSYW